MLRWLEYTNHRAVFVVSRDGGAQSARSSQPALKSARFYRTVSETFMLPETSIAVSLSLPAEPSVPITASP